jgi:hypothetical protein
MDMTIKIWSAAVPLSLAWLAVALDMAHAAGVSLLH